MSFWRGFEKRAFLTKRPYKDRKISELDPHDPSEAWTAKVDGAHTIVVMRKGKTPELFSHRTSKRTGGPIGYNAKLPHIGRPSPITATLRGETYAVDKSGRAVAPEVVTALLNRTPERSLELQRELGLRTRTALIDVDKIEDKPAADLPFKDKRSLMARIVKDNPDFTLPAMAISPAAKEKLRARIIAGTHPQTAEGLVVHDLGGTTFSKAKIFDEHDVYIRDVFHEQGKPERAKMAGGFHYSWKPDGPIVGRVGTGFDHAMKKDMLEHPENYVGRVARVAALGVSKNKVLMKPAFKGFHVEKNLTD